ncbi:MAG TPA: BTAD domain-containing putative transcriptional regulator [Gaiella sp.]|nr:BTAD domain-containing putative transcriptional regulator [Gaiella sp.]
MGGAALEVGILGPLIARRGGSEIALGGPKQKALLARLAVGRGRTVSVDHLVDAVWGGRPPRTAEHAVQVYVSELRKAIGREALVSDGVGYRLSTAECAFDVARFETLAERSRALLDDGDASGAARTARDALSLWRGQALADVAYEEFAQAEVERLEALRLSVVETRIGADLRLGRAAELVGELEALVAEHPRREPFVRDLMLALYRSGRQADALDVFRNARRRFVAGLGVEPGRALGDLERAILRQEGRLLVPDADPRAATRPAATTSFVGRGAELLELRELLSRREIRLVTLVGPGGVGKTRLALEAASILSSDYADGVVVVELAPLMDASLVSSTIGHAIGDDDEPANAIGDRGLLLVIDNFEHVLEAAPEIPRLLRSCPRLDVLCTSRERLRVRGEQLLEVPPLVDNEAIVLFEERARAVRRSFAVDDATAAVCSQLDGLPLAIELAAARVDTVPTTQMATMLDARLGLLVDGPRDAPARQRTLSATVAWSVQLLQPAARQTFARLSVFAGSFTAEAAAAVTGAARAQLDELAERSLVRRSDSRYALLETIREFARGELDGEPSSGAVRAAHARWYLAVAEDAEKHSSGPQSTDTFARLDMDLANFGAALEWSSANDATALLGLAAGLWRFWESRGRYAEAVRWLGDAVEKGSSADDAVRARALNALGVVLSWSGDQDAARRCQLRSLALARSLGDVRGEARALGDLGVLAMVSGDRVGFDELTREAIDRFEEIGDVWGVAVASANLGYAALLWGEYARAMETLEKAREVVASTGDVALLANCLHSLAVAHLATRDIRTASTVLAEALERALISERACVVACLDATAALAALRGDRERARPLRAGAAALRAEIGAALDEEDDEILGSIAPNWEGLSDARSSIDVEDAVTIARSVLSENRA